MSTKKPDISQIKKYLQNELDARAMHQLERNAQDDPFFAEAMEGFENSAPDQEVNYADLQKRLGERLEPAKERNIWLWRVLPIAACLLIALLIGYEYLSPKKEQPKQFANTVKPVEPSLKADSAKFMEAPIAAPPQKQLLVAQADKKSLADLAKSDKIQPKAIMAAVTNPTPAVSYKADTVEYKASDYKVNSNSTADELLKKMEGFEVDSNGNVTHQGQAITKARLNGRDYAGGNLAKAVQSLPADIVEKIQVVDDYGDQAARTGIKDGDPKKVLNLTTRRDSQKVAARFNRSNGLDAHATTPKAFYEVAPSASRFNNASPVVGQKAYNDYLTKNAVTPNGEIGTVEVGFIVADNGTPENIHVISSDNKALNDKALDLISKGSKWIKSGDNKEVRLKIVFHKP